MELKIQTSSNTELRLFIISSTVPCPNAQALLVGLFYWELPLKGKVLVFCFKNS